MKHKRKVPHKLFAETKMGIVTRFGDWFHTTREQIEEFVPGLLAEVDLEELVRAAQAWVKSADSLSMLLLLGLLVLFNPYFAAVLAIIFHAVWYFNKSSLVMVSLNKLMEILYKDGTQLLASLVVLSYLGYVGKYLAASIGLLFFFILKLGLLRKLWDKLFQSRDEASLTLNDRVMKMVILRFSIQKNIAPDNIQQMEKQIADLATIRSNKK